MSVRGEGVGWYYVTSVTVRRVSVGWVVNGTKVMARAGRGVFRLDGENLVERVVVVGQGRESERE